MSKLPQGRAQRMLMDLISQPGNGWYLAQSHKPSTTVDARADECADCKASSPRWTSYNIGIFLWWVVPVMPVT